MSENLHAGQAVRTAGTPLAHANAAVIAIHGRGASADDILSLAGEIAADGVAYLAPQARGNTWYPYSFLAPMEANEPWLSSALAVVGGLVEQVRSQGMPTERIVLMGFSQGACLASEFAARTAQRYGGLIALSGGIIGPDGTPRTYPGTFDGMPAFFGCSDVDPHIPAERVRESASVYQQLGADVTARLYRGMGHTVNLDEIGYVQKLLGSFGPREPTT